MPKITLCPALSATLAATLAFIGLMLASCATPHEPATPVTSGTVITHVTVVNTRDGTLQPGMSVVIQNGKISTIAKSASITASGSAQTIDASGKFVVPGYNDMHTHAMANADEPMPFWPAMLANGITGIREMAGNAQTIARARKLNADSAAGRVLAPEVLSSASNIVTAMVAPPATSGVMQQLKNDGADYVKTVSQNPGMFPILMAESKRLGLPVAGHIAPGISATEASNAGWRAVEHLGPALSLLLDCSTDEEAIRSVIRRAPPVMPNIFSPFIPRLPEVDWFKRVMATYSEERCVTLARTFAKNETWQVPSLYRVKTMQFSADAAYRTDPNLKYVEAKRRAQWQSLAEQYTRTIPAEVDAVFRSFYDYQLKLLQTMRREKVRMLTGSDMTGIWCIPGFSLHEEFKILAQAGFTPLEILQMSTVNAAEFLKRSDFGQVDEGKTADLVLLDANPLLDAANLSRIWGVVVKGRYQSRAALQKMLDDTAAAYRN